MERKLSGGCACRAVRYEAGVAPVMMLNCHCRDCQQAGGSAYAAIVVVSRSSLDVQGELRFRETVGDNEKPVRRGFCPACGSQVLMELGRLPEILALHAGSLDDPSIHQPKLDLFTASAQPWDAMLPDTRKVAAGLG